MQDIVHRISAQMPILSLTVEKIETVRLTAAERDVPAFENGMPQEEGGER
jgi:hypothetical protein